MIDSLSLALAQQRQHEVRRSVPLRRMAALAACCRPSRLAAGLRTIRARLASGAPAACCA